MNKTSKKPVTCTVNQEKNCEYSACKKCYLNYFLDKGEMPHCMACKTEFNNKFLVDNFGQVFLGTTLKQILKKLLLEKEKPQLKITQAELDKEKRKEDLQLKLRINSNNIQIEHLRMDSVSLDHRLNSPNSKEENEKYNEKIDNCRNVINLLNEDRDSLTYEYHNDVSLRTFTTICPMNDCNGYLSLEDNKCGICNVIVCKECWEPLSVNKITLEKTNQDHVCDPDVLANVKLIKEDTRGCPKCATTIYRIDGCFDGETLIPMFNGTFKQAKDIQIYDTLLGDDGDVRIVLNTFSGEDQMYTVEQFGGTDYTVNSEHTLVLKKINDEIVEIKVKDYIELDIEEQKKLLGFKESIIEFWEGFENEIEMNPYELGRYLGGESAPLIVFTKGELSKSIPFTEDKIPENYLANSIDVRSSLLLGILSCFENKQKIRLKSEILAREVLFLASSLGENCFLDKEESCTLIFENILNFKSSISVKSVGKRRYYGFELDSNNRFLGIDFTVLHNCKQMFCTNCNTKFDWDNGNIILKGSYHNPHHMQYLKSLGNKERNVLDVECGREIDRDFLEDFYNKFLKHSLRSLVPTIYHNIVINVMQIRLKINRNLYQVTTDNNDLRRLYLRGYRSTDAFVNEIYSRHIKNTRIQENNFALYTFLQCMTDILYRMEPEINSDLEAITRFNNEIINLCEIFNGWFSDIKKYYGGSTKYYVNFDDGCDLIKI